MRVTLLQYMHMSPEQARHVTHVDCVDDEAARFRGERRGDAEEWAAEAVATGLTPMAGGGE